MYRFKWCSHWNRRCARRSKCVASRWTPTMPTKSPPTTGNNIDWVRMLKVEKNWYLAKFLKTMHTIEKQTDKKKTTLFYDQFCSKQSTIVATASTPSPRQRRQLNSSSRGTWCLLAAGSRTAERATKLNVTARRNFDAAAARAACSVQLFSFVQ